MQSKLLKIFSSLFLFSLIPSLCFAGVDFIGNAAEKISSATAGPTRTAGQPFTAYALFRPDSVSSGERVIVGARSGSGAGDLWKLRTSGDDLGFQYDPTGSGASQNEANILSVGIWYCAFGWYDGTDIKLYFGTSEVDTDARNSAAIDQTNLAIGRRSDSAGEPFNGVVAEVAIWTAALTATERALLVNSKVKGMPLQIQPSNLYNYYPLDDLPEGTRPDGQTFADRSGNGRDLTGTDADAGTFTVAEEVLSYP